MGFKVSRVSLQNFGPFESATVELDRPGITLVEGQMHGVKGCTSNGSGKSFLLDAVVWALYGRCLRASYTGDSVIRIGSTGGAVVTVDVSDAGQSIRVSRHRSHPKYRNQVRVEINGADVTRGTDAETDLVIERALGMDFMTFCNAVAFGGREDVRSFFSATDTDRKKVLDTMLGLGLYAEAESVARQRLRSATVTLEGHRADLLKAEARLEENRAFLVGLEAEPTDAESDKLKRLETTQQIEQLKGEVERRKTAISDLEDEFIKLESEHAKAVKAWQSEVTQCHEAEQKLNREEAVKDTDRLACATEVRSCELAMKSASKLAGECPECHQVVPAAHAKKLGAEYAGKLAQAKKRLAVADAELEALRKKRRELARPDRPIDTSTDVGRQLREEKALQKADRESIATLENLLKVLESKKLNNEQKIAKTKKDIAAMELEVERLRGTISEHEGVVASLDFWVEAFGNQGLKSFLIEAETPEINKQATKYAQRLLGQGAVVRLSATTTLKGGGTREKLSVDGSIPGCARSYAGASKGQKRRMDIALLLAFRKLIAARSAKAFDQLFVDEIFDGLDSAGVEVIGELLREEANHGPVFLVTHSPEMKSLGDRFLTVSHDGTKAVVLGQNPVVRKVVPNVKVRKVLPSVT